MSKGCGNWKPQTSGSEGQTIEVHMDNLKYKQTQGFGIVSCADGGGWGMGSGVLQFECRACVFAVGTGFSARGSRQARLEFGR